MTIIPQNNENNQEYAGRIFAFLKAFEVDKVLRCCNAANDVLRSVDVYANENKSLHGSLLEKYGSSISRQRKD